MEHDTGAGLGWALAMMAVAAIFVGWLAQSWKRRTGAAWGCGTFLVMLVIYNGIYFIVYPAAAYLFKENSGWEALGLMTAIIGVVLLTIIIATLPQRPVK